MILLVSAMMMMQTPELMMIMLWISMLHREPGTFGQVSIEAHFLLIRTFLHFSFPYFSLFSVFLFIFIFFIIIFYFIFLKLWYFKFL